VALDLTNLLTTKPIDPENYNYVDVGTQKGWLPLAPADIAQRDADAAALAAAAPQRLKDYASAKRRAVIDAGASITVGASVVPSWTDAASQGAITGLVVAAQINPTLTTGWKGRDGVFYPLDAAGITTLALGMMAFVQSAFATEAQVLAAIDAATITTPAQIDAAAWPSNA